MKLIETILHKAALYPVVAFDVFDTLIKRDVARPTDLFALLGADFAKARIQAEAEARAAKSGEVTLAEIYARPCLAGYDPAAECAAEIACAVPNLPVLKAARALYAQGKRLYYISDMYLPKVQLDAMLAKCGYDFFDGGFVSADYGVQKRSGKLFRLFLQKTQTQAKEVLFIGDNWRADVAGSALAGIRSWHLPTQEVPRESLPAGAVAAFTANRLPGIESEAERLGFATLGPLAVAYCQWLHAWEQQHPNAKIYFLARDMYLMRQVYALLYPQEQTAYLQVSRRSLCPLLLAQHRWDLLLAALPRQSLTGAQIAAYCGTACPMDLQEKSYDLKHGPDTARPLLQALATPQGAAAVSAYLTRQNLQAGDILVDIGSGGTTQMLLQAVCNIKLHGCQLSCDDRLRGRLREDETAVFLFDGRPAPLLYWAGQPMLERLISEDVGATLGYTQTDKTITVQQASQPPTPLLDALQKGILRFAQDWQKSFLQTLAIPPQTAISPFLRLVGQPTAGETALLGDLTVEDGGVYPLATPRKVGYYLTHANQAKQDLSAARWKIGFLKRLAPLPLPYDRLYAKMKK